MWAVLRTIWRFKWDFIAWRRDCMHWRGKLLTGHCAHWCYDWDGLPVDETCGPDWEACQCWESRGDCRCTQ